jgi:SAM-dependent methyltransferase
MDDDVQSLVAEQITYYRAHAPDYDNDIAGLHPDWSRSIDELPIAGDVLELACGSGRWTRLLAARARSVTAVDAAPEMLALARQRVRGWPVELVEADVFGWQPAPPLRHGVLCLLAHPCAPGTVRGLLVAGRGGPGTGRTGLLRRRHRPGTRWRTGRA